MNTKTKLKAVKLSQNLALLTVTLIILFFLLEILVRSFIDVRVVGPTLSVYDPVYGSRLKVAHSSVKKTPEFTIRVTTNSYGFRGPEPESKPKNPVLFLGDSFTLGYGVNDGEEFPARIREALIREYGEEAVPVVNAGVGNVGNGHWIKFLQREAPDYAPRLVVLQPLHNDFGNNIGERLYALDEANELKELPVPPPSGLRKIQNFIDIVPGLNYSHVIGLGKQLRLPRQERHKPSPNLVDDRNVFKPEHKITIRIIERALQICQENQWPVVMINIDIEGDKLAALHHVVQQYDIPLIQFPGKAKRPGHFFKVDGHWNATGHEYAAEVLYEYIKTNYVEPSEPMDSEAVADGR